MASKRKPVPKKKSPVPPSCTLMREYVLCGKPGCAKKHGPYWYAYWKEGKRTRKRYVGSDQALARLIDSWGDRAGRDVVDEEYEAERKEMYGGEISTKGRGGRPRRPWARGGRWGTHRGVGT